MTAQQTALVWEIWPCEASEPYRVIADGVEAAIDAYQEYTRGKNLPPIVRVSRLDAAIVSEK